MTKYIAVVKLVAYDTFTVDAPDATEANRRVIETIRAEDRYSQRKVRPMIAELHYIREHTSEGEIVWARGRDLLRDLLMGEHGDD